MTVRVKSAHTYIFIKDGRVAELVLIRVIKLTVMFLHENLLNLLEVVLWKRSSGHVESACSSLTGGTVSEPTHDDVLYAANNSIEGRVCSRGTEGGEVREISTNSTSSCSVVDFTQQEKIPNDSELLHPLNMFAVQSLHPGKSEKSLKSPKLPWYSCPRWVHQIWLKTGRQLPADG